MFRICGKVSYRLINSKSLSKSIGTNVINELQSRIKVSGPITVADYMKEVLTNQQVGYYMDKDVFGSCGDFITSPEVSQLFGELIAVWCVNEWINYGSPKKVFLVELGPGRGTLTDDILRVFTKFKDLKEAVSVHMVEVSPKLSCLQREKLISESSEGEHTAQPTDEKPQADTEMQNAHYQHCESKYGPDVYWYDRIKDVPEGFSFYIANEFFDALPIHVFQKINSNWHEVLIDIDDTSSGEHHFKYVLTRGESMAAKAFLQVDINDMRNHIEVSPASGVVVQELASRISSYGGSALIADYGHSGDKSDTFRGFKNHKLHDVLCEPGSADLTADVDFSYLKKMCHDKVDTAGPISQKMFLENMGIGLRMQMLLAKSSREQHEDLMTGYDMLLNPQKMGNRFQFFSIFPKMKAGNIPAGFFKMQ